MEAKVNISEPIEHNKVDAEGAKEEAKMASEETLESKETIFDKYERKKANLNDKIEEKYPKVAKHLKTFSEVW